MLQFVSGDATVMGEVAQWVSPSLCCTVEQGSDAVMSFGMCLGYRKSLSPKVSQCKVCQDVLENVGEG